MITDKTTRIGIIILETLSIPLRTPAYMIARVIRQNTTKQISTETPFEIYAEKYPSSATACAFPFTYSTRYFNTHPPITE